MTPFIVLNVELNMSFGAVTRDLDEISEKYDLIWTFIESSSKLWKIKINLIQNCVGKKILTRNNAEFKFCVLFNLHFFLHLENFSSILVW